MKKPRQGKHSSIFRWLLAVLVGSLLSAVTIIAAPLPGGTLDPTSIPKYVTPLVIPPVMNTNGAPDNYDIAVRQFEQQILPGGVWNSLVPGGTGADFPATKVWSYGPDSDPTPAIAPDPSSQFNYPAYTVETMTNQPVNVKWLNELIKNPDQCKISTDPANDPACNYLPHFLPVDQTLHWANPPMDCRMGDPRTDCAGDNPDFYTGPVPMVTHLHGAHVDPHSDGYPEAWWLPAANNIPAGYATTGRLFDDSNGQPPGNSGYVDYVYRNDQPATTLWYHDHTLGMTRTNVYAGPAGFWLIRGGANDKADNTRTVRRTWDGRLPGPAPIAGDTVLDLNTPGANLRDKIREIPIVIQDRSFNADGSLFYPDNRAFFEGVSPGELQINFVPNSDIAPIWNPEAFFNTMVVNGVTWPSLEVAPALYRFRLLNGTDSRFLNMALFEVTGPGPDAIMGTGDDTLGRELPFYQIGAEQGFLPQVVQISTGFATALPGNGRIPRSKDRIPAASPDQALLLGPAERADVLVDFRLLRPGMTIRMINTAPDAPFGGFPDTPADPGTTGQVMQFTVNYKLFKVGDVFTTPPWALKLNAEAPLGVATASSNVSLNEGESEQVCILADALTGDPDVPIVQVDCASEPPPDKEVVAFAPKEALLGTVGCFDALTGDLTADLPAGTPLACPADQILGGNPLKWTDATKSGVDKVVNLVNGGSVTINVTENPDLNATEEWNIVNFTEDAHPIHLHLIRFQVIGRTLFDGTPSPNGSVQPWETGFKDTVIAYPGQITTIKAKFDVAGLYVWHCHILEHEDNEMMRPYIVGP